MKNIIINSIRFVNIDINIFTISINFIDFMMVARHPAGENKNFAG